jgi:hypothetical protein
MRIEPGDGLGRARDLGNADLRRGVHDLALQVVERYPVVVDNAQGADARRGQIHDEGRAETARAHHKNARGLELLLPLTAHLAQHQMPLVALDLQGVENHGARLVLCRSLPPA